MLPAVMESNDDVLYRLEALKSAYSDATSRGLFDEGEGVDTYGEKWSHKWGGRIMGDYVNWANQSVPLGGQDYFEFRRLRLSVSGNGYGVYDYKFDVDFEPENTITDSDGDLVANADGVGIRDMYVGIHDIPFLGYVRFGHFKTPFSLEQLTGSKYITFMERSLPNIFVPLREVGIAAYNHSAGENVTWAFGAFFDSISPVAKERVDDNQGMRFVARTTWTPYYDELAEGRYLLHTGLGFHYTNDQDGSVRFASRPEIHEGPTLVDSGTLAVTDYSVVDAELAWVNGPLSLQSEFMWTNVNVIGGPSQDHYGAYVYGSYFLTGKHRPYNRHYGRFERIKPLENLGRQHGRRPLCRPRRVGSDRPLVVPRLDGWSRRRADARPDRRGQLVLEPAHAVHAQLDSSVYQHAGTKRRSRHHRHAIASRFLTSFSTPAANESATES